MVQRHCLDSFHGYLPLSALRAGKLCLPSEVGSGFLARAHHKAASKVEVPWPFSHVSCQVFDPSSAHSGQAAFLREKGNLLKINAVFSPKALRMGADSIPFGLRILLS